MQEESSRSTGRTSDGTTTFTPSPPLQLTSGESICSQGDSPARRSVSPTGTDEEQLTIGGSGQRCVEFATYSSQSGYWSRTSSAYCQLLMRWDEQEDSSEAFLQTWPASGFVTSSGTACQLATSVRRWSGGASGSLPTPAARESKDWSRARILADLDRGDGVAKRICALSPSLRQSEEIGGLDPSFAEWMMGFPEGWTDVTGCDVSATPACRSACE